VTWADAANKLLQIVLTVVGTPGFWWGFWLFMMVMTIAKKYGMAIGNFITHLAEKGDLRRPHQILAQSEPVRWRDCARLPRA
jgi:hypothetical protein